MQARIFALLGMQRTTFDFARAMRANYVSPHSLDIDAKSPTTASASTEDTTSRVSHGGSIFGDENDMAWLPRATAPSRSS